MKQVLLYVLFLGLFSNVLAQDKVVYSLLANGSEKELQEKIETLDDAIVVERAYKGALLAKNAQLVLSPKEKLTKFKKGAKLMDSAIEMDPINIECRLLRYIIQSKAPSFLGYNKNLQADKNVIESKVISDKLTMIILDFNKENPLKAINTK